MAQPAATISRNEGLLDLLDRLSLRDRVVDVCRALVVVNELAARMSTAADIDDVDHCLADGFRQLMPAESVRVCARHHSSYRRRRLSGPALIGDEGTFPLDEGTASAVLNSGRPAWVHDAIAVQTGNGTAAFALSQPRSLVVAPIRASGEIVGCLEVVSTRPNRFSEIEYRLVLMVSSHLSSSIENILVRRRLAAANETLLESEARLTELNRRLQEQANRDELTGLFNKRRLLEQLDAEMARARRYDETLSCMMIDLDHFKQINDALGHPAGDEALRQLGALLRSTLRVTDFVARYGGEEFTVILPRTDLAGALRAAENILNRLRNHAMVLPGGTVQISASIGIACCSGVEQLDSGQALFRADQALYRAKRSGRDCVCVSADNGFRLSSQEIGVRATATPTLH